MVSVGQVVADRVTPGVTPGVTSDKQREELSASQISAYATGMMLAEWMQKGDAMMSGYLGKVDDFVRQTTGAEMVGKQSFAEAKPKITAFVGSWLAHAAKDRNLSSEGAFRQIEADGGLAKEGLEVFRQMLAGSHKLGLQGDNAAIIKQILQSEATPAYNRGRELLTLAAERMAMGSNSPRAANELAKLYQHDSYHEGYAKLVLERPVQNSNVSTSPLDLVTAVPELGAIAGAAVGGIVLTLPARMGEHFAKGLNGFQAVDRYATGFATTATAIGGLGALQVAVTGSGSKTGKQDEALVAGPAMKSENGSEKSPETEYRLAKERLVAYGEDYLKGKYGEPFTKTRKYGDSINYGKFFTDVEQVDGGKTADAQSSAILNTFREDVRKSVDTKADFYTNLGSVRSAISQYVGLYNRELTGMSDGLNGQGTNCVGRTKLMISALQESGIVFPEGVRLGVQVYKDHLEPVLYDTGKGTALGLIDGQYRAKIDTPIYHPDYMVGYSVAKLGRDADKGEKRQELIDGSVVELIAGDPNKVEAYMDGEPPRYSVGGLPLLKADWEDNPSSGRHLRNQGAGGGDYDRAVLATESEKKGGILSGGFRLGVRSEGGGLGSKLVFANEQTLDAYNSLASNDDRQEFLVNIYRATITDALKQEEGLVDRLIKVNENPSLFSTLSSDDLAGASRLVNGMATMAYALKNVLGEGSQSGYKAIDLHPELFSRTILPRFEQSLYALKNVVKREPLSLAMGIAGMQDEDILRVADVIEHAMVVTLPTEAAGILASPDEIGNVANRFYIADGKQGEREFSSQDVSQRRAPSASVTAHTEWPQLDLPVGPAGGQISTATPSTGFSAYLVTEGSQEQRQKKEPMTAAAFVWFFVDTYSESWIAAANFQDGLPALDSALRTLPSERLIEMYSNWGGFGNISPSLYDTARKGDVMARNHKLILDAIREVLVSRELLPDEKTEAGEPSQ